MVKHERAPRVLYPEYPFKRPRERRVAFLVCDRRSLTSTLTDGETGEIWTFPFGDAGYEPLVKHITKHHMSVFCEIENGTRCFAYVDQAIHDDKAKALVHKDKGLLGFNFRRGHNAGSVVSGNGWGREMTGGAYDAQFASDLRHIGELAGVGIHDSPSAFGCATLNKFWTERKLNRMVKLPNDMMGVMDKYKCGGRIHDEITGHPYPILHEADIRQAYPTTVAAGLPWNVSYFSGREPTAIHRTSGRIAFGLWKIYVTEDIECSPIPNRDWDDRRHNIKTTWRYDVGVYEYAGWDEEIEALRATGKAVAIWQYGWVWTTISAALKPWVDQMKALRATLEAEGNYRAATYVKIAVNAAIGTWSMEAFGIEAVPIEYGDDDIDIVWMTPWSMTEGKNASPLWTAREEHDPSKEHVRPRHWGSYVRMRVRMTDYRIDSACRDLGINVVANNIDSIQTDKPIPQELLDSSGYEWKLLPPLHNVSKPYARATVGTMYLPDGSTRPYDVRPGMPRKTRT